MIFRFSCFSTHSQSHKQKKMVHLSTEAMQKTLEGSSKNEAQKNFTSLTDSNSPNSKLKGGDIKRSADCPIDACAVESQSNSDEVDSVQDISVLKTMSIKKCHSLGTGLDLKGRDPGGCVSEDGIDQQFSSDGSHDNCGSLVQRGGKDLVTSLPDQFQEANPSESLHVHDDAGIHDFSSMFSVGDAPHSGKGSHANLNDALSSGEANNGGHTPFTPTFEKPHSLPNIDSPGHFTVASSRRIRSAEDLSVLYSRRKEMMVQKLGPKEMQYPGKIDALMANNNGNNSSFPVDDTCISYNYVGSPKDWVIPLGDELSLNDNIEGGDSSFHQWNELPNEDFKVKRIEEWVIDLQNCNHLDENDPLSALDDSTNAAVARSAMDVLATTKLEGKYGPGMEAVKKYISSLSPSSTTAQLVNYGLAVIPFFSHSSLRALNLSGNAIVRITAGSLPRGLHILNLSKNKISTIEGLRELTRLRVLDLSYNRILRIGHGLASCSSLKELYLAGNKISEVEGLHRLLKLNVVDLRFNKISTTKGLGQLAANYNSLQAISLEGNPAQRNVGDEQMKKYLLGLLPHLSYFNRQAIKVGTLKDAADRSARMGMTAHQMDRNLKADSKLLRKGTHAAAAAGTSKVTSSSIHGRRNQATGVSKSSSKGGKHARLPPTGTKPVVAQQNQLYKFVGFKPDLSMRRSRSEGTLGAL